MNISGKHTVEAIDGVRCAVVDKEATPERADFLKRILEHNGYTVHMQQNVKPAPKPKPGEEAVPPPPQPLSFKVGVTDLSFVVSNMLYDRSLKTLDGKVLLPTYWTQEDPAYEGWYWEHK
jgi:hypothetical protein